MVKDVDEQAGRTREKSFNLNMCPECESTDVTWQYESCLCHRTYEGNGETCWKAPVCNSCGYEGIGSSDGGGWYRWWKS